jgi:hypothetical protein
MKLSALLLFALSCGSASADPKSIANFFPGVAAWNIDDTALSDLKATGPYGHFDQCARGVGCDTTLAARFYQLGKPGGNDEDTYNLLNRCIAVLPSGNRDIKGWINLDPATHTISCSPSQYEIQQAQVALCYERTAPTAGGYCSLATFCFEGSAMKGRCTKDFPAEEVRIIAAP